MCYILICVIMQCIIKGPNCTSTRPVVQWVKSLIVDPGVVNLISVPYFRVD